MIHDAFDVAVPPPIALSRASSLCGRPLSLVRSVGAIDRAIVHPRREDTDGRRAPPARRSAVVDAPTDREMGARRRRVFVATVGTVAVVIVKYAQDGGVEGTGEEFVQSRESPCRRRRQRTEGRRRRTSLVATNDEDDDGDDDGRHQRDDYGCDPAPGARGGEGCDGGSIDRRPPTSSMGAAPPARDQRPRSPHCSGGRPTTTVVVP